MGDVSEHLSRREFACPCGCGFDVADIDIIYELERLATSFGNRNIEAKRIIIHINSANRCAEYDRALKIKLAIKAGKKFVPKKQKSQHINGMAVDFWMQYEFSSGVRKKIEDDLIADELEMIHVAKHGIGRYKERTHYDVRRNGPARWDKR